MAFAHGALDTVVMRNFAVCACAYADIVAKLPVVEIVAAKLAVAGKGGGFVMQETGVFQCLLHGIFDVLRGFVGG